MPINGFRTAKVLVTDEWKRLTTDASIVTNGNILIRVSSDNKDIVWISNNTDVKTDAIEAESPFPLHPGDFFTMRIRHPFDVFVMTDDNKEHILWWMVV